MADEAVAADIRREIDREQQVLLLQNVRASTLPTILVGALYAVFLRALQRFRKSGSGGWRSSQ